MPSVAMTTVGQPFEVFLSPGETIQAWFAVPDRLANPETGFTDTSLVYWEPWPRDLEEDEHGNSILTTFTYTQGSSWNPDVSPFGAALMYWKNVTNPGAQGQSFIMLISFLP